VSCSFFFTSIIKRSGWNTCSELSKKFDAPTHLRVRVIYFYSWGGDPPFALDLENCEAQTHENQKLLHFIHTFALVSDVQLKVEAADSCIAADDGPRSAVPRGWDLISTTPYSWPFSTQSVHCFSTPVLPTAITSSLPATKGPNTPTPGVPCFTVTKRTVFRRGARGQGGRGVDFTTHPPSSDEFEERVELYLYFPSRL
jgi:hypothetical protein